MKYKWTWWAAYPMILVPVGIMTWHYPSFGVAWTIFSLLTIRKVN